MGKQNKYISKFYVVKYEYCTNLEDTKYIIGNEMSTMA